MDPAVEETACLRARGHRPTRSWWRSGWVTRRRGCSSSTMQGNSIARTRSSRALWTLRHVCGTGRVPGRAVKSSTSPDLRVFSLVVPTGFEPVSPP